jgi:hypothetical protein
MIILKFMRLLSGRGKERVENSSKEILSVPHSTHLRKDRS